VLAGGWVTAVLGGGGGGGGSSVLGEGGQKCWAAAVVGDGCVSLFGLPIRSGSDFAAALMSMKFSMNFTATDVTLIDSLSMSGRICCSLP
jgi:hypothetical protein